MNGPDGHSAPMVTVLLPVYNAGPYLTAALDSILGQTYRDFEILAIDDGSTDDSKEILRACSDPRLRTIAHPHNLGLIASLNEGLEQARGRYVARMDGDDLMLPDRLARQVAFLDAHPDVAVVAGFVEFINADGEVTGNWDMDRATGDEASIAAMLPRTNCIAHPSVMLRRSSLGDLRYDRRQHGAEDWDLWLRMAAHGKRIAKINEVLIRYRVHGSSIMGGAKAGVPYELRLLRTRGRFLSSELMRGSFGATHAAVLYAQLRTLLRHLRRNVVIPFMRGTKRVLGYSPVGLWRESRALDRAERTWMGRTVLLFPYLHTGGAEQVHADIAEAVKDGQPLIVICGFSTDRAFAAHLAEQGHLLELPRLLNHPFTRRSANARLARLINRQDDPALLSSNTSTFFDLLPLLKTDVRTHHLQHAFLFQPMGNLQHKAWLEHFDRVDGYLFISGQAKAEYEHFLFANHVPRSRYGKLQFISNAVRGFGQVIDHDRTGLLFVGRSSPEKRLPLFLALCDHLEREAPGRYRSSVVGSEVVPGHPHVRFHGMVQDRKVLSDLYADHDILVVTSYREGFPLVIMEAMAHGLTVISTPVGDIPNRLDASMALITSGSDEATVLSEMGQALLALDADRTKLRSLKEAALALARREFAPERFRASYRALLIRPRA